MTLLSLCQAAADNIGIAKPSTIIGNSDPGAQRLLQMARREANNLSTRTNWVAMVVENVFITNGTSDYFLPPDFRSMVNNTMWDRSRHWRMRGAMSPQQWQFYKSSIFGRATIERRWRLRLSSGAAAGAPVQFEIDPATTETSATFVYEYVSENWGRSATLQSAVASTPVDRGAGYKIGDLITLAVGAGTATQNAELVVTSLADEDIGSVLTTEVLTPGNYSVVPANPVAQASSSGPGLGASFDIVFAGMPQSDWKADSDMTVLDEDLIELGVIWRTLRRIGLAYDEERAEYENQVRQSVARDGGTSNINLVPQTFLGDYNFVGGTSPGIVLTTPSDEEEDDEVISYLRVVPVTGATLVALAGLGAFRIDPLGELAALTVVMPPNPTDGTIFRVSTTQTLDALTIVGAGTTTMAGSSGGPYVLAANGSSSWQYDKAIDQWLPAP